VVVFGRYVTFTKISKFEESVHTCRALVKICDIVILIRCRYDNNAAAVHHIYVKEDSSYVKN
jgi:hypothetical protein